ncbi:MAG: hypothetical protein JNK82_09095 [Myxococcaceae bacterium]|nr:hypothetical protein [Myxococcaceae bacterium]
MSARRAAARFLLKQAGMRTGILIAAAAVVALAACQTDTRLRNGHAAQPVGETRPNDASPMRGDETVPGTSGSTGIAPNASSGLAPSGSQIDRSSSTPAPDIERERYGRRPSNDSTSRRPGTRIPSDESEYTNPFAAAKTPRDAGTMAATDGGTHFENSREERY